VNASERQLITPLVEHVIMLERKVSVYGLSRPTPEQVERWLSHHYPPPQPACVDPKESVYEKALADTVAIRELLVQRGLTPKDGESLVDAVGRAIDELTNFYKLSGHGSTDVGARHPSEDGAGPGVGAGDGGR
jgi:hypothetical protein